MTFGLKTTFIAGLALGGVGFAGTASALPAQALQHAVATSADAAPTIENVRLICPPYRPCFYAPGGYYGGYPRYGYGYGYYRPRPFYRPYGFYGYRRPFY